MGIHSIGVDIIEIDRIDRCIQRYSNKFLNRIFTRNEIDYCQKFADARSFAGRFAAKEALFKATGRGMRDGMKWTDIEIVNTKEGKPEVKLRGVTARYLSHFSIFLSISHSQTTAIAMVVVESDSSAE